MVGAAHGDDGKMDGTRSPLTGFTYACVCAEDRTSALSRTGSPNPLAGVSLALLTDDRTVSA